MKRLAYILLSTILSFATSLGIYAQNINTKKTVSTSNQTKTSKAKKIKGKKNKNVKTAKVDSTKVRPLILELYNDTASVSSRNGVRTPQRVGGSGHSSHSSHSSHASHFSGR